MQNAAQIICVVCIMNNLFNIKERLLFTLREQSAAWLWMLI